MSVEEFSLEEGQVQEQESWVKEKFPDVVKGRAQAAQIQAQIQQFVASGKKTSKIWEFLLQRVKDEQLLSLFFEMYQKWTSVQVLAYMLCPFIGHFESSKSCDITIVKISDYINWIKREINDPNLITTSLFKEAVVRIITIWNIGEISDWEISKSQLKQAIFNELEK